MSMPAPFLSSPISILIIDDDENLLELLAEGFKLHGFDVLKAKNGLDGWCLFRRHPTAIVLTDMHMPGLDGKQLSYRIRHHSSDVIIAVMTGGDTDLGKQLLTTGIADHFFTKPFSISNICQSLQEDFKTT